MGMFGYDTASPFLDQRHWKYCRLLVMLRAIRHRYSLHFDLAFGWLGGMAWNPRHPYCVDESWLLGGKRRNLRGAEHISKGVSMIAIPHEAVIITLGLEKQLWMSVLVGSYHTTLLMTGRLRKRSNLNAVLSPAHLRGS